MKSENHNWISTKEFKLIVNVIEFVYFQPFGQVMME